MLPNTGTLYVIHLPLIHPPCIESFINVYPQNSLL